MNEKKEEVEEFLQILKENSPASYLNQLKVMGRKKEKQQF